MVNNRIVTRDEWLVARKAHLANEKELTRLRDQLSAERRELPWVKIDKRYVFDGPQGKETLADLFDGRSQLVIQHFMFGPGWKEGCVGCSFSRSTISKAHWCISNITMWAMWPSRERGCPRSRPLGSVRGGASN